MVRARSGAIASNANGVPVVGATPPPPRPVATPAAKPRAHDFGPGLAPQDSGGPTPSPGAPHSKLVPVLAGALAVLVVILVIVLSQGGSRREETAARDTRSDGRYTDNGDGTVTDSRTGLMWSAKDNGSDIDWDDAKRFCENFTGGGYSDWRMPTIAELHGLYDTSVSQIGQCDNDDWPLSVTPLIRVTCHGVWSSETQGSSDARGFTFKFRLPFTNPRSDSEGRRALPIRGRRKPLETQGVRVR